MATTNPLLDDIAGLMTGAMGAARAASEEAKTAAQARVKGLIADMDLAGRDEVEALKTLAWQPRWSGWKPLRRGWLSSNRRPNPDSPTHNQSLPAC